MKTEPKHLLFTENQELNAQVHVHCPDCGAPVGEPCKNVLDGATVHIRRLDSYRDWMLTYNAHYRSKHVRRHAA